MSIILILHNIRSAHNIGSIFRTAEGFGVDRIVLSGYSPYPLMAKDSRLPHVAQKLDRQISKTALGAERMVKFEYHEYPDLAHLKANGYRIVGLEQDERAILLPEYRYDGNIALLLGEEVRGLDQALRAQCEDLIEIPMQGKKESFNVSVACAVALYGLNYMA